MNVAVCIARLKGMGRLACGESTEPTMQSDE
jgi:hypothetical protein